MDAKELFKKAVAQATEVIEDVRVEDFGKPTPDTEWDVWALLDHMLGELAWSADTIEGKTIEEVGENYSGDLIGADLQGSWRSFAEAALTAIENANPQGTAHLSFGDFTLEYYLRQVSNDLFIHAWDLGEALSRPVQFAPDIAEELYDYNRANADNISDSGLFATPVTVGDGADTQTKLLALTGRSVEWRPDAD